MQKEVSNQNSNKLGTISTKVLKDSLYICNSLLQKTWNYEILGKQDFPKKFKTCRYNSSKLPAC